jgi:hypothetical protein
LGEKKHFLQTTWFVKTSFPFSFGIEVFTSPQATFSTFVDKLHNNPAVFKFTKCTNTKNFEASI